MFILPSIKHVLLLLQGPRRPQIKTILKIYLHCYIAHFFVDCPKQIFINLLLSIIVDFKLLSCASCFFILVCKNENYSYLTGLQYHFKHICIIANCKADDFMFCLDQLKRLCRDFSNKFGSQKWVILVLSFVCIV